MVEQIVDDIDGTVLDGDAAEAISFAVNGRHYTMDLSTKNAESFHEALAPYVKAAHETSASKSSRSRTRSAGQQRRGYDLAVIREWAQENGYEVAPRGRVANAIIEAYNAEH